VNKGVALVLSLCAVIAAGCTTNNNVTKPDLARAADINLEIGVDYLRKNDLKQAKEKIDKSIEQNPRSAKAQVIAGMLYDRLGDSGKADSHYQRAVSLEPDNPEIKNNYAVFQCQKKRYDRGEKLALEAAANPLYKTPEIAYLNAGNCARGGGNLQHAEDSYRRALAVKPRFSDALYQMAELEYQQKEYMSARGFLERYNEVGRTGPATLWLGVRIERSLGNKVQAQHYAQRLKIEYPTASQTQELLESERNPG
jgi:type IV pilus assembly protein PilF